MRLHSSVPRFITRYQYLQEHVSRLTLDESAADTANVVHEGEGSETYPTDNQQNSDETTGLPGHGKHYSDIFFISQLIISLETETSIRSSNSHPRDPHEETRNFEEEQTSTDDLKEQNSHDEEVGLTDAVSPHDGKDEDSEENSLPPPPAESLQGTGEVLEHNFVQKVSEDHLSTNEESEISDHVSTVNDDNAILDDEGNVISLETLEEYPHDEETFGAAEEEDLERTSHLYETNEETDNIYEVVANQVQGKMRFTHNSKNYILNIYRRE